MIREDLVASAVTFLQDPGVASSPLDKRVAFLQSKNLTQEEVETALARAGEDASAINASAFSASTAANYGYQKQQMMRQPAMAPGGYGGYGYWGPGQPAEVPRRDWRDWFIMATLMGGLSYGMFFVAKRYIYPLIAPPTTPQLQQDKASIDEAFAKAFALLDQLKDDTEALKKSEEARSQHLDTALQDVDTVMGEMKRANERRREDAQRFQDELRSLRDLIPKAMEAQKEATDGRLKELNGELKSLKTLVGNRMGAPRPASPTVNGHGASGEPSTATPATTNGVKAAKASAAVDTPKPNRAAIPAWQMAAAGSGTEASGSASGSGSGSGS